jgi:hypothetical protein
MKKVLIGCGLILGLGVLTAAIFAFLGYRKLRAVGEAGEKLNAEHRALNQEFPWDDAGGAQMPDEARLRDYLAVRKETMVPFREFSAQQAKFKEIDRKNKETHQADANDLIGIYSSGKAMVMAVFKLRTDWYKNLREHRMSPLEFAALTGALYPADGRPSAGLAPPGPTAEQRALQTRLDELNRRLADPALPAGERSGLEGQRDAAAIQIKASRDAAGAAPAAPAASPLQGEIDELRDAEFDRLVTRLGSGAGTQPGSARPLTGPAEKTGGDGRD